MNFHTQTLPSKTRSVLDMIKDLSEIQDFYLTGGTALAMLLGHRESEDLGFFTKLNFQPLLLQNKLSKLGNLENVEIDKGTLNLFFKGVKLQFLYYPYDVIEPFLNWNGINLSSMIDIACTKLITVSMRGSKKDFVDMYVILKETTLDKLFLKMKEKYKNVDYNQPSILKSLVYFNDAEHQPMPKMHTTLDWQEVKKFLTQEVKKITF